MQIMILPCPPQYNSVVQMTTLAPTMSDAPMSGADAGNPEVSLHVPLQRMQIRSHLVVPLFHVGRPCVSYPTVAVVLVRR